MGHLVSYNIFDAALQDLWLCVILSLWSQPVPLFTTLQAFLFLLLHWSLLWRREDHVVN